MNAKAPAPTYAGSVRVSSDDSDIDPLSTDVRDLTLQQLLVLGLHHLVSLAQVDPQLQSDVFPLAGWHLCVDDPPPSSHPLEVPRVYGSPVSAKILVFERPLQHVCHLWGGRGANNSSIPCFVSY